MTCRTHAPRPPIWDRTRLTPAHITPFYPFRFPLYLVRFDLPGPTLPSYPYPALPDTYTTYPYFVSAYVSRYGFPQLFRTVYLHLPNSLSRVCPALLPSPPHPTVAGLVIAPHLCLPTNTPTAIAATTGLFLVYGLRLPTLPQRCRSPSRPV